MFSWVYSVQTEVACRWILKDSAASKIHGRIRTKFGSHNSSQAGPSGVSLCFQAEAGIEVFASAYRRVLSPAGRVIIGLLLLNFCGCGRYAGEDLIKP
ncbi:MAG: hypothetical protein DWI22_07375 [Planctomycetota bacterium]|nr:MAG: hypothetical protein DWI22_07375 [Planctomycetota bacterium]